MKYIVVFITASKREEAVRIASILVKKKLAACVNIVSNVTSVFSWQGKIENCKERLLIVKTQKVLFKKIANVVRKNHSYTVPEIIVLPIIEGSKPYLDWIKDST